MSIEDNCNCYKDSNGTLKCPVHSGSKAKPTTPIEERIAELREECRNVGQYDPHSILVDSSYIVKAIAIIDELQARVAQLEAENAALTAVISESNEVCLCGCPAAEHEQYGEDGEGCGNDSHECVRTCVAIRDMHAALTEQQDRLREACEAVRKYSGCFCEFDTSQLTDFPMLDHGLECKQLNSALDEPKGGEG